ncbi:30S ribosomal protein S16 [Methylacidimicrobium tartarophylax]|uniref:Small ribosomal subunit protein bS16 n=1 Tax=Methylacidimicrobium tartarophylax TaxID=1041768 RepID=A0A5E6MIQ7_9BACT|nr:30S ribosomal protein S16 [Methylacidimicrobium tartarophylax]VVM08228.1 30S ribosomal protein S16 [Methylacidimicrobium tartarophylax]
MAVAVRLRREGRRNRPFFRIVVADRRAARDGKFLEAVGTYDPVLKEGGVHVKLDRIEFWTKQGAQLSETVAQLVKRAPSEPTEKEASPAV